MSNELSFCCHAVNFLGVIWQPYRAYYINNYINLKSSVFIPINLMSKQKHSPLLLLEYVFLLPCSASSLENAEAVRKGFFRLSNHFLWKTFFQIHRTTAFLYCQKCGTFLLTLPVLSLFHIGRRCWISTSEPACQDTALPLHTSRCTVPCPPSSMASASSCCRCRGRARSSPAATSPGPLPSNRAAAGTAGAQMVCVPATRSAAGPGAGSDQSRAVRALLFGVADGNLEG